jgi:hypothetical protein
MTGDDFGPGGWRLFVGRMPESGLIRRHPRQAMLTIR